MKKILISLSLLATTCCTVAGPRAGEADITTTPASLFKKLQNDRKEAAEQYSKDMKYLTKLERQYQENKQNAQQTHIQNPGSSFAQMSYTSDLESQFETNRRFKKEIEENDAYALKDTATQAKALMKELEKDLPKKATLEKIKITQEHQAILQKLKPIIASLKENKELLKTFNTVEKTLNNRMSKLAK